jgi:hypothetical protein
MLFSFFLVGELEIFRCFSLETKNCSSATGPNGFLNILKKISEIVMDGESRQVIRMQILSVKVPHEHETEEIYINRTINSPIVARPER